MKPSAIYSKSGKGVQEASGKTSLLKRGDRAVLSAIDGRATLSEVAQKVGKPFDAEFEKLIAMLDKDGFVREVATAAAASTPSRPSVPTARAAAKPAGASSSGGVDDLDFTSIMPAIKPTRTPPSKPAPPDASATQRAKEQEAALYKARQEAEARAQAERDRLRQEAEAKARAEAEAKIRAETEKKLREEADRRVREEAEAKAKAAREEAEAKAKAARLEAEAKANAAREAALRLAAEAKAKAEAEAQARIEAERKAREEAERKAREEAEKARREAEELRQRLEEERKAREEAERKRKEEEERRRIEEQERRAREEAERKAREEAERKLEEERKAREEAERKAREEEERRLKEVEARLAREAEVAREQQARELEEARSRARSRELDEERARRSQKETQTRQPTLPSEPPPAAPVAPLGGGSLDALMADLDSFSQREEAERRARDATESTQREEKKRRAAEEAARRRDEEERRAQAAELERQRAAEEAKRREEEAKRRDEEARRREEEERRAQEEAQRRAREAAAARKKPADTDIEVSEADLGMDDVRRDEAAVAREARKAQREREREARKRMQEAKSRAEAAAREEPVKYPKARRPIKWGRPLAITFFVALVAAIGGLHVMPLPMADYESAASEALGRPVRIGSAHLSLFTGVRLNLANVTVGDSVRIAEARAYPRIGSLFDERKSFGRIELSGMVVPQQSIGAAVGARLAGRNFDVERIVANNVRLEGPVPLPAFEAEARAAVDGTLRELNLRGRESLDIKLSSAPNGEVAFDVTAASVAVPFVPELTLSSFAMKGTANGQGMRIASWGGSALDGVLSGSANVRWFSGWQVEGTMTVRNINAAVFAPALLSEGKAEGSGRFSMAGSDPAKLHQAARMDGSFSMGKGALGTVDLSRVLQTSGRQHGGRTPFTELTGQGTYDRGAVSLRNINISAGALTAAASADIAPGGALSGRIVADVRTTLQPLRATLVLGGTVKEPQVRN